MAEVVAVERPRRGRKGGAGGDKKKGGGSGGGGGDDDQAEHDLHIWTERERRKKMRTMFSDLHALLPHLPPKADKSTIVDEAVKYIKTLQHTFQNLQKQKLQKLSSSGAASTSGAVEPSPPESRESFLADSMVMRSQPPPSKNYSMAANMAAQSFLSPATFQTWLSPNVVINMCGNDAQIAVCTPPKRGLLATVFYILEKHNLELLSAHVSSDQHRCLYMIHVQAGERCDQFIDTLTVEEVFKLAAGEMNLWLLTC